MKVSESRTLARKRKIRVRARGRKNELHNEERQVLRRKERASKENLSGRSRRKNERLSRLKISPKGSAESWFHSKSGLT